MVSLHFRSPHEHEEETKKKIEQLMASVSYGLQVVGLVLISFVIEFFSHCFLCFSHPPSSLFLTLSANPNQHLLYLWADSVCRRASFLITFDHPLLCDFFFLDYPSWLTS